MHFESAPFSKAEFRRHLSYALGYGVSAYKLRSYWSSMERVGYIEIDDDTAILTRDVLNISGNLCEPDCIHPSSHTCDICGVSYSTRSGLKNHLGKIHCLSDDELYKALGYQDIPAEVLR